MSVFKKLFGGGKPEPAAPSVPTLEHAGFLIRATPFREGGQFQLSGVIEKEIGGELKSHSFIRADKFPSFDDAAQFALSKGRQIIDERGDAMFG
ncbi:MAG: HlyU family transcriptional regulator [Bosea sp. (in: a-proteobacteria)]